MYNINDLLQEMWDEIICLTDLDTALELNNHNAIKRLLKQKIIWHGRLKIIIYY